MQTFQHWLEHARRCDIAPTTCRIPIKAAPRLIREIADKYGSYGAIGRMEEIAMRIEAGFQFDPFVGTCWNIALIVTGADQQSRIPCRSTFN